MKSKTRDHVNALERRLKAWRDGDIVGLLRKSRTIQNHLPMQRQETEAQDERLAKTFSRLVMDGKINAALRYLYDNFKRGVLSLDHAEPDGPTVREILPSPREVNGEALY